MTRWRSEGVPFTPRAETHKGSSALPPEGERIRLRGVKGNEPPNGNILLTWVLKELSFDDWRLEELKRDAIRVRQIYGHSPLVGPSWNLLGC